MVPVPHCIQHTVDRINSPFQKRRIGHGQDRSHPSETKPSRVNSKSFGSTFNIWVWWWNPLHFKGLKYSRPVLPPVAIQPLSYASLLCPVSLPQKTTFLTAIQLWASIAIGFTFTASRCQPAALWSVPLNLAPFVPFKPTPHRKTPSSSATSLRGVWPLEPRLPRPCLPCCDKCLESNLRKSWF